MATSIDDNAADEKSDKSIWRLLNIHCTSYLVLIISVVFLLIFLAVLYVCPAEPEQEKTAEDCV